MITQLIWNGCDGYIELDELRIDNDYYVDKNGNATLYTTRESFTAFPAVQVALTSVPMVDGEYDFDGLFMTESGRVYRALTPGENHE